MADSKRSTQFPEIYESHCSCPRPQAVIQGCDAVILGGIGIGTGQSAEAAAELRLTCLQKLCALLSGEGLEVSLATAQRRFWELSTAKAPVLPPEMARKYSFDCETTQVCALAPGTYQTG